jgi:hypothetical protein
MSFSVSSFLGELQSSPNFTGAYGAKQAELKEKDG